MTTKSAPLHAGLTTAEGWLVFEVIAVAGAAALWWFAFSVHSPDAAARARAVARIDDAERLAAYATLDESWEVRESAVRRMPRSEQVARLAGEDAHPMVRLAAAEKMGDQAVLGALATRERSPPLRHAALRALVDPGWLVQVAGSDGDADLRQKAVQKLSVDKLERAAREESDVRRRAELIGASRLLAAASRLSSPERRAAELMAVPLRLADPAWVARFGPLQSLQLSSERTGQSYSGGGGGHYVEGEAVTLTAFFGRGGAAPSASLRHQWRSQFPSSTGRGLTFVAANVEAAGALATWAASQPGLLAQLAADDALPSIRKAAIERVSDKALLERIAEHDSDVDVRNVAARRARVLAEAANRKLPERTAPTRRPGPIDKP